MNEARNDLDGSSTRKQAEKVKTQAREIVELLEEARKLMAEDNPMQLAMRHIDEVISEAESRAGMLEDWYRRTYSTAADSVIPKPGI
jgi:hypothetical protein